MTVIDPELDAVIKAVTARPRKGRKPVAAGGSPGTVNRKISYVCECCKRDVGREMILAREVTFIRLTDLKRVRTRRTGFICDECVVTDPDFNRERYTAAPGVHA